ncbi:MAG: M12 family metallo-peptidase [Bacteroidota bacterium]
MTFKNAFWFIVFAFISCSCSTIEEEVVEEVDIYKETLLSLGFAEEHIQLVDDGYMVEGDLLYTYEVIKSYMKNDTDAKHQAICTPGSTFPLDEQYVSDIEIFIDQNTLPLSWINPIKEAIAQFNAVQGTSINMRWRKYFPNTSTSGLNQCLARGVFSSSGASAWVSPRSCSTGGIGWQLVINLNGSGGDFDQRVATVMHELGHVIGYFHTDTNSGTFIPGTCLLDPLSIMTSSVWGYDPEFTTCDIDAFQMNYPD